MATKGEKMDVSDGELESDEEGLEVEKKSLESQSRKRIFGNQYSLFAADQPLPSAPSVDLGLGSYFTFDEDLNQFQKDKEAGIFKKSDANGEDGDTSSIVAHSEPDSTTNGNHHGSAPYRARGGSGGGRPMRGTAVAQSKGGYKLFIKLGDDSGMSKEVLEAAFSSFGTVTDVYVPDNKPFAFVSFEKQEAAEQGGTALNGSDVNGIRIFCDWATPKEGGAGGSRNCHKCSQPGHFARDCTAAAPVGDNAWGSSLQPIVATAWGSTASAETTPSSAPVTCGWGNDAAITNNTSTEISTVTTVGLGCGSTSSSVPVEPLVTGWGAVLTTASQSSAWGDQGAVPSSHSQSNANRDGFSGRGRRPPMRGTPSVGPRGGFKLFVKLGDSHNLNKDVLEGAFAAHGTVTDCYVPQGKQFAFVTYGTQEDAEKGGNALNGENVNGTKIFCNWATPKQGCGGGAGVSVAPTSSGWDSSAESAPAATSVGWGNSTCAAETAPASTGWGSSPAPAATSGGWGHASVTTASAGDSGWGSSSDNLLHNSSSVTPARGGFSGRGRGRPMRGTPTLGPRGGYKLFVKLGEGHSITKEVLEGAFAAHGNVTDAYVPDGKAFGFVTYGTQEEAEKGGEALNGGDINGTKVFCNWATPKEGGSGGGRYDCGQTGHMARDCTGVQNSMPAASGGSGWGQGAPSGTPAAATGWGEVISADVPVTTPAAGGWGDAPAVSAGGWNDTPSATMTAAPPLSEEPMDSRPLSERLLALAMVPGLDVKDPSQSSATVEAWGSATSAASSSSWGMSDSTPTASIGSTSGTWGCTIATASGKSGGAGDSAWGSETTPAPSEASSNRGGFAGRGRGRPMRGTPVANPRGGYKLFVKLGDNSGITKEHLETAFSPFGTVTDAFAPDGKPFAFITYETQEMATQGGTALNGTNLNGKKIYCDWAGPKPGGGGAGSGAPGTCFKCGQGGHMARECTGGGATQNSSDSDANGWGSSLSATSSGWGRTSDSQPTGSGLGDPASAAPPVLSVGGWGGASQAEATAIVSTGWGDTTSAVPVAAEGRWGDASVSQTKPATTQSVESTIAGWEGASTAVKVEGKADFVASGLANSDASSETTPASTGWGSSPASAATSGGWGNAPAAAASNGNSSWGINPDSSSQNGSSFTPTQGGKGRGRPMRGTPTLGPRGGYKLFVKLGEGHSITKEVLEGAFAAHGNVTDAYVPDGKAFGFVTYGTQEEAEKGGEALNGGDIHGTKVFCNWATPKEGGAGVVGPRTCHKCGQAGHMARDCTSALRSTSDASGANVWGSSETSSGMSGSSWGGSLPAAAPVASSTEGWGKTTADSGAASTTLQSATSGSGAPSPSIASGWGDAGAATTAPPVVTVGGWGNLSSAASGGWGSTESKTAAVSETASVGWAAASSTAGATRGWGNGEDSARTSASMPTRGGFSGRGRGRPMRGTPTLGPRGGYKLFVKLGEGHSITKDVLEAAFAAHGAVTDCYLPDGKPFAFVTYGTQDDAEKGGNALNGGDVNGIKIFCNWATPKEGGAGVGGPRTCHKCGQPGHMARECTGGISDSTSSAGASDTWGSVGDSGWGSTTAKSIDSAAVASVTSGWGGNSGASSGWTSDSPPKSNGETAVGTNFPSTADSWGGGDGTAKTADAWGGCTAGGWGVPESRLDKPVDRIGQVYTKEEYEEKKKLDAVEEIKRAKEQEASDLETKLAALKRETQMEQQRLYATQRKNRDVPPPPRRKSEMMAGIPQYQDILAVAHLNAKPQPFSPAPALPSVLRQSSYVTRGDLKMKLERDASFITPATREPARPSSIIPVAPPTGQSLAEQATPKSTKKAESQSKRATSPVDLFFPSTPAPRGRKRKSAEETADPQYSGPSGLPVAVEPAVRPSRTRSGAKKMTTAENQPGSSTLISATTETSRKSQRSKTTTPTAQPIKRSLNDPPPYESPPRERALTRLLDSIVSPKK